MFNQNDPVGAMAKKMGELFVIMVDEAVKEFGEEKGTEVARRAVRRFGENRGRAIRKKVLDAGEKLTFENMEKYYDLPDNEGWDADVEIDGNVLTEFTRYCPFAQAFREAGLEQYGKIYCEIDIAINQAYMGNIKFERPCIFHDGTDAPCKMVVTKVEGEGI